MAIIPKSNGLITENARQYYEGAQEFRGYNYSVAGFTTDFNTDLYFRTWNEDLPEYTLNNFKLYTSPTGIPGTYQEYLSEFSVSGNTITFPGGSEPASSLYVVVQLKILTGGKYGNDDAEKAYGQTVEDMEKYYDNVGHVDWTHKISKAKMLKAQHPGYEVFKMGIHGQRGVSCSDCRDGSRQPLC